MRELSEYEITLRQLFKIVHVFTEKIAIDIIGAPKGCQVLTWDAWGEKERMEKYYHDIPLWNITAELEKGYHYHSEGYMPIIVARCYYKDIEPLLEWEKADIKKAKRKAYYQSRKKSGTK